MTIGEEKKEEAIVLRGTDLSDTLREFLFNQKRRIAFQLKIQSRAKVAFSAFAANGDENAKAILTDLQQMIKVKKSFDKRIIPLIKEPLKKRGRWSETAERYYFHYSGTEKTMGGDLKAAMTRRQIWTEWLSKIQGIDLLLAAEVVGAFEWALKPGETIASHFKVPSQMWAFAGLNVNPKTGKPPKKVRDRKLSFCLPLRSILVGRVGPSFVKQDPVKSSYRELYDSTRKKEYAKLEGRGIKIVPAAKLPKKGGKKYEPEGVMSKGHVHRRIVRRVVKIFVAHLWEKCRELEGLPHGPEKSYAFAVLGHPREGYIAPFQDKD